MVMQVKGLLWWLLKLRTWPGKLQKQRKKPAPKSLKFNPKNESVDAIDGIIGTIRKINNVATSIILAVEEQGVATQEITYNVEQAAMGTNDVTINITVVNQPTQ